VQLPVIECLRRRFNVENVDMITEAGIDKIFAENKNKNKIRSILERIDISLEAHNSEGIAVIGHSDCAGNPVSDEKHIEQIQKSVEKLKEQYDNIQIIGLWIDENWNVNEIGD
ncbi:MAG: carbonic anhydrase, partial [Bacteroidota bacterium]